LYRQLSKFADPVGWVTINQKRSDSGQKMDGVIESDHRSKEYTGEGMNEPMEKNSSLRGRVLSSL